MIPANYFNEGDIVTFLFDSEASFEVVVYMKENVFDLEMVWIYEEDHFTYDNENSYYFSVAP